MRAVRVYGPAILWAIVFACILGFGLDAPAWAAVGFGFVAGLLSVALDMLAMACDVGIGRTTSDLSPPTQER